MLLKKDDWLKAAEIKELYQFLKYKGEFKLANDLFFNSILHAGGDYLKNLFRDEKSLKKVIRISKDIELIKR